MTNHGGKGSRGNSHVSGDDYGLEGFNENDPTIPGFLTKEQKQAVHRSRQRQEKTLQDVIDAINGNGNGNADQALHDFSNLPADPGEHSQKDGSLSDYCK